MQPDQTHPATTEATEAAEPSTSSSALPEPAAGPRDTAPAPSESESYLDLARVGRGRGRYYLLGMLIIIFVDTFASGVIWVIADALLPAWAPSMTADLIAFLPLFAIVLLVVVFVHRRGWRSVITGRSRLIARNILRPALLSALLVVVVISVPACLLDPDGLRFGVPSWSAFAAAAFVAVLLIPFQAGAEELFCRGYLMQWVSLATRRRWVLATINGLFFTVWHLPNPELAEQYGPAILLALLSYFATGFTWAWVCITTGSIEAAIGAHIANNLVVTIIIAPSDSVLGSTSLISYTSPDILLATVSTLVVCLLFTRIVTGRSRYWSLARTSQYAAGRDGSKVQPALPAPSGS